LVAESLGDQTAIVDEGVVLSFQDLLARSELLSRSLEEAALLPGDRVGALLSNGLPFAISAFAAWKCGLVLVPLHVRLTERELLKQASDCGIRAVFTSKRLMPAVEIIQAQVPRVQHAWFWKSSDEQPEYQHGTTSTIQQARQEDTP
jgi:fatty-acyl-CoA synthase